MHETLPWTAGGCTRAIFNLPPRRVKLFAGYTIRLQLLVAQKIQPPLLNNQPPDSCPPNNIAVSVYHNGHDTHNTLRPSANPAQRGSVSPSRFTYRAKYAKSGINASRHDI